MKWVLARSLWLFPPEPIAGWVSLRTDAVHSGRECTNPTASVGNSVLTGHLIPVHFFPCKNNLCGAPITHSGAEPESCVCFELARAHARFHLSQSSQCSFHGKQHCSDQSVFKGKTIMSVCHLWLCAETQPSSVEIKKLLEEFATHVSLHFSWSDVSDSLTASSF